MVLFLLCRSSICTTLLSWNGSCYQVLSAHHYSYCNAIVIVVIFPHSLYYINGEISVLSSVRSNPHGYNTHIQLMYDTQ